MVLFLHKFVNEYVTFGRIRSKFKHLYNIKIWLGFSSFVLFSTMIIIFLLSYFFGVHFIIIESPMNQLVNVFFDILLPIKEFFQMILGMDFSQSFLVFKGYIIRYTYICLRFIGYNFEGLFVFFIVKFVLKIWLGYHLIYSFLSVKQDYLQRYKLINTMLFMGILIFFFFRDYFVFFNFVEGKYLNSSEILNVKYFNKRNRTKIMTEYIDKKSFFFNQMVYILSLLKINFDVYESFLHIFYFRNKMYMRYYYFLEKFRFNLLGFYYKNRRPTGKNMKFDYIFNNSNYGRNTIWSKFGYKERLRLYKEYRKRNRYAGLQAVRINL